MNDERLEIPKHYAYLCTAFPFTKGGGPWPGRKQVQWKESRNFCRLAGDGHESAQLNGLQNKLFLVHESSVNPSTY